MPVRRVRVQVEGIVQGVGFRPFVHALASDLGLGGSASNDVNGLVVEVEGPDDRVDMFVSRIRQEAPPLAEVENVEVDSIDPVGGGVFVIAASEHGGERHALISPDAATCDKCVDELFTPADRRFRYPFVNCTNCGPRFTIIRDVPYDRPATTMATFAMCSDCEREYRDPGDRRFHAQPVCCPACGPQLSLVDGARRRLAARGGDALTEAVDRLRAEQVVAVKGLGGYHLAVVARSEKAASALRSRKHREDKPFAVMVRDLDTAGSLCEFADGEQRLLTSIRRPIVLLRRRGAAVAPSVAPDNHFLGLMLPYTPLHHLLLHDLGEPLVLTSANRSDEPIAYRDDDALGQLAGIADAFLTHNRPIHIRTDDSVARVVHGREMVLRRSRGFVPHPVTLAAAVGPPVLGCGAELKNTFCLAKDRHAFMSHHIGDLETYETYRAYTEGIDHFERLFEIQPDVIAHDLHPEYLSTKYAVDLAEHAGVRLVGVQHHHAHIASCLADNREAGPVIGVAFDGLGFGLDGTIWGGEFLVADLTAFQRAGALETVPMPGGTAAIKEPWRMAAAYLDAAFGDEPPAGLVVERVGPDRWAEVVGVARAGVNSPRTSSAGRLFDAAASILGVRDYINYEGQAAIELEQLADPNERDAYTLPIVDGRPFRLQGWALIAEMVEDLRRGTAAATAAARFHRGVADGVIAACTRLGADTGLGTVALSGGVFQNVLLLKAVIAGLRRLDFRVLTHGRVPTNDGGISLGQVAVAAASRPT